MPDKEGENSPKRLKFDAPESAFQQFLYLPKTVTSKLGAQDGPLQCPTPPCEESLPLDSRTRSSKHVPPSNVSQNNAACDSVNSGNKPLIFGSPSFSTFSKPSFTFCQNTSTEMLHFGSEHTLKESADTAGAPSSPISKEEPERESGSNSGAPTSDPLTTNATTSTRNPFKPESTMTSDEQEVQKHLHLLGASAVLSSEKTSRAQEVQTTPLFSRSVQRLVNEHTEVVDDQGSTRGSFPQYGLLGIRDSAREHQTTEASDITHTPDEDLIYANMNAPWSAFICGSQGAGKSHTLSCLLENCLLATSASKLPDPLTGIVFHYDKFTSHSSTQLCEAAYLCSAGIPVRVLVSPSNIWNMTKLYSNLPGLPANAPKPKVIPLYLQQQQLNIANMMTLMAVSGQQQTPLYLEVLFMILREMAMMQKGAPGLDYAYFKSRLEAERFSKDQLLPLKLRLQLLESFMDPTVTQQFGASPSQDNIWDFEQGSLTIVDLSCPFVNENDACALFSICLSLFLENRNEIGRVVALDEAHKFLTQSGEATKFTDQLVSIICQQRHLATRILIATQEPTLSPRLLDLCNVSIVHRFLSPAWFATLKGHLAGAAYGRQGEESDPSKLFQSIVALRTGEALVFCPTAMLGVKDGNIQELGHRIFKMRVRKRVTADGGKSIMASEKRAVFTQNVHISFVDARPPMPAPASERPQPSTKNATASSEVQEGKKRAPPSNSSPPKAATQAGASHSRVSSSSSVTSSTSSSASSASGSKPSVTEAQMERSLLQSLALWISKKPDNEFIRTQFGEIRRHAARSLGLDSNVFDHSQHTGWYQRSKKILLGELDKQVAPKKKENKK